MLKLLMYIGSFLVLIVAYIISTDHFADYILPPLPTIDSSKIWKVNNIVKSEKIELTSIKVPEHILSRLSDKLKKRILPRSFPESNFKYGFNNDYVDTIIQYWSKKYNWTLWENKINELPHYFTRINGLKVHFIHIRPTLKKGQRSIPILLLHGWPGSFFEFYKMIPMLTNNMENEEFAFEVICPSLPGFGWSEAAEKPGFGITAISMVMINLMERLNITTKFYVQGGDFGSLIAAMMSKISPSKIAGIHVHFLAPAVFDIRYWIKLSLGAFLPKQFHFLTEEEQQNVYPYFEKVATQMSIMGYFWLQATRPNTIGIALSDSPTGLAAYILEKFGAWSSNLEQHLNSPNGRIEDIKITKEEMLTNVMIYYVTNSIASSVRLYKEMMNEEDFAWMKYPVRIPVGIINFPNELVKLPRHFVEYNCRDLRQFSTMVTGGHFAALEEPALVVEDLKSFINSTQHDH